jgi:hypothetical protein
VGVLEAMTDGVGSGAGGGGVTAGGVEAGEVAAGAWATVGCSTGAGGTVGASSVFIQSGSGADPADATRATKRCWQPGQITARPWYCSSI